MVVVATKFCSPGRTVDVTGEMQVGNIEVAKVNWKKKRKKERNEKANQKIEKNHKRNQK